MANVSSKVRWNNEPSVSFGASVSSDGIRVDNVDRFSIQLVWSGGGSPVGSLKLQVSNDLRDDSASVAHWTDLPDTTVAVSDDGDNLWDIAEPTYRWVRVVYTRTSGSAAALGALVGR